jgi:hypothetical protein
LLSNHLGLTQWVATHITQKHFKETESESNDIIAMIKARLQGRNKDDILNMDQTLIAYSFHSRMTLEAVGMKTIQDVLPQLIQNVSMLQPL